mmetsp:Transcript_14279/g.25823  ORF Transcript_14279/g.25823 Transcript_14279/m.25823 type:complete len:220 (+) Transcript_14279:365-1024(+)
MASRYTVCTFSNDGTTNMVSISMFSVMDRSPRAPDPRRKAIFATSASAHSVAWKRMPFIANWKLYCFMSEFFGSVSISTRLFSSKPLVETMTGNRPTNSGIMPNWTRSLGMALSKYFPWTLKSSMFFFMVAPKPMEAASILLLMIVSRPAKAPPLMKRMLEVSIWMKSPRGFLRPGSLGTLITLPSTILSNACCTPSPDTSRLMLTFPPLLRILSVSST